MRDCEDVEYRALVPIIWTSDVHVVRFLLLLDVCFFLLWLISVCPYASDWPELFFYSIHWKLLCKQAAFSAAKYLCSCYCSILWWYLTRMVAVMWPALDALENILNRRTMESKMNAMQLSCTVHGCGGLVVDQRKQLDQEIIQGELTSHTSLVHHRWEMGEKKKHRW